MLNTALIEEFRRINAEGRTGALTVHGTTRTGRFHFEQGELCILDFCADKEALLAQQYRSYNKIGAEIEALLREFVKQPGARAQDFLLRQQLVTNEEVEQVTRTLVEDTLCELFGNPHQNVAFDAAVDYEAYDLDRSAVKLRIQVEMLLRMVESRVGERDTVLREMPSWDYVFRLVEGAPDASRLNEMERHVLHFVDGRKSVQDIAAALRESCLNIGCYLISLKVQGYIRPSGTSSTRRVPTDRHPAPATTPTATPPPQPVPTPAQQSAPPAVPVNPNPASPAQQAVARAAEAQRQQEGQIDDFQVYHADTRTLRRSKSRAPLIILMAVLLVVGGVFVLVVISEQSQEQIRKLRQDIDRAIEANRWTQADDYIVEARRLAANDQTMLSRLEEFRATINEEDFAKRLARAEQALAANELETARAVLADLPDADAARAQIEHLWTDASLNRLAQLRDRFDEKLQEHAAAADQLATEVRAVLADPERDPQAALEAIAGAVETWDEDVAAPARAQLREWRVEQVRRASITGDTAGERELSIIARERILQRVLASSPDEELAQRAERILENVRQEASELEAGISGLEQLVESGDYRSAEAKLAVWRKRVENHPIEARLRRVGSSIEQMQQNVTARLQELASVIATSRDPAALSAQREKIAARLAAQPQFSAKDRFTTAAELLARIERSLEATTIAEELAALRDGLELEQLGEPLSLAIRKRIAGLEDLQQSAQEELARARELREAGELDEAAAILEGILADDEWTRTTARPAAADELASLEEVRRRHAADLETLHQAMLADDLESVRQLQQQLNLPRMPLAIHSDPQGAAVHQGDEQVGTTPMIVNDPVDEQGEPIDYRLELPGYRSTIVSRADQTAGWRIRVDLERAPLVTAQVDGTLTSRGNVIDDTLWVAGIRGVYAIHGDGQITNYAIEGKQGVIGRSLSDPVYAPVTRIGESLFLATRDFFAIEIVDDRSVRRPLEAKTNHALVRYASRDILNRRVLIVTGLDGRVHANDPYANTNPWSGVKGAAFAGPPVLVDDTVLVAREDGRLESYLADTGQPLQSLDIGEPIATCWASDGALHAIGLRNEVRWDGGAEAERTALPFATKQAGPDCAISSVLRVWVRDADAEGGWVQRGRLSGTDEPTRAPVAWNGQAVITLGATIRVLGDAGFTIESASSEYLEPVADGERLWVGTLDGGVACYAVPPDQR